MDARVNTAIDISTPSRKLVNFDSVLLSFAGAFGPSGLYTLGFVTYFWCLLLSKNIKASLMYQFST